MKKIARTERKEQRNRVLATPSAPPRIEAKPTDAEAVEIDLKADLWKYALLIMSVRPDGKISTSDLIKEIPLYVRLSDEHTAENASRKDSKFSQIVRNLKSHKNTKTNFIYQGYAQDVPRRVQDHQKGHGLRKGVFPRQKLSLLIPEWIARVYRPPKQGSSRIDLQETTASRYLWGAGLAGLAGGDRGKCNPIGSPARGRCPS